MKGGDDTFSELNRVEAGSNGGWIQIMGPQHRFFDYKEIEVTQLGGALQQVRFPPTRLADSAGNAQVALFMLLGAKYMDPELSWKYESGPARTAFGPRYRARRRERGHALVRIVARVPAGRRNGRLYLPGPVVAKPEEGGRIRPEARGGRCGQRGQV
jgi:hypothetical protein